MLYTRHTASRSLLRRRPIMKHSEPIVQLFAQFGHVFEVCQADGAGVFGELQVELDDFIE